jgi:exopolyphosphatase/guanosine-5'-triphosphate,3'-diphosphate pyrophosphatase
MHEPPGLPTPAPDPEDAPYKARRHGVVDLGSNSVRLVVFDGARRNPMPIFNEKAVLRLGRGLESTGRLNEDAMAQALVVMTRYHEVARAMRADPFEVLATAAVRDATNGPGFVRQLGALMPGVPIRILSGEQEAGLSADGVLCGIPRADGILADIGGGSLELVRLERGRATAAHTLSLGVLRLTERAAGDLARARAIAEADLAGVPFLPEGNNADLYVVGGAWRALARIHMAQIGYPLNILHHYTIRREEARDLTAMIAGIGRRGLERLPGISRRRIDDLPMAAVVLRRVLRATGARRIVFSASGLREGWLFRHMAPEVRAQDPMLEAATRYAHTLARDPSLPPLLMHWTDGLFPDEPDSSRRLREAACWFSDTGSHDHPEYRPEHSFARIFCQPGIGLDHHARAFLALATAIRYEANPAATFLDPARLLLDLPSAGRAELLGAALRLAYTLSAGTPDLLAETSLVVQDRNLVLRLGGGGAYAGDTVLRRLDGLAQTLGLSPVTAYDPNLPPHRQPGSGNAWPATSWPSVVWSDSETDDAA